MEPYVCSVCNQKIDRDIVLYIQHTQRHIVDEIKKKHPEWVSKDGVCPKCFEYYDKAMGKS